MKAFAIAMAAMIVIGAASAAVLIAVDQTTAERFAVGDVRLQ